ncbi:IclR family transcriptional regulator [Arthrobacter sp. NPDC090010]|uniref:IclR family transcriptional regulator n=1 Tax=Arthrobacter sp. NPDC090010 TaxID=3363942 RepID=UPI003814720A
MIERVPSDERQGIQSVEIAMTVLEALEAGRGAMTLNQIAKASDMATSKVHRYLVSLGRAGLVAQSPGTGRYDLGPGLRRLGIESLRRMDDVEVVAEYLPGLRDRTGHAVNLAVWGDRGPTIVRWHYGSYALPITVRVGATLPIASSSVGRAFMAHLPVAMVERALKAEGIASREEMQGVIDEVLTTGLAVTTDAMIPGVTSIAAAVVADVMALPIVIATAMPTGEISADDLLQVGHELRGEVERISQSLGSIGTPGTF